MGVKPSPKGYRLYKSWTLKASWVPAGNPCVTSGLLNCVVEGNFLLPVLRTCVA